MTRNSVSWFADQMENKLLSNDYKGGWRSMHIDQLMNNIREEIQELKFAIEAPEANCILRYDNIIDECADVANYAMMIADICQQAKDYFKKFNPKGKPCNTK